VPFGRFHASVKDAQRYTFGSLSPIVHNWKTEPNWATGYLPNDSNVWPKKVLFGKNIKLLGSIRTTTNSVVVHE